jgi:hypothetical protein
VKQLFADGRATSIQIQKHRAKKQVGERPRAGILRHNLVPLIIWNAGAI